MPRHTNPQRVQNRRRRRRSDRLGYEAAQEAAWVEVPLRRRNLERVARRLVDQGLASDSILDHRHYHHTESTTR
jgi:hypothetical protein